MNISKKAIMSLIMALTSVVSMAQPYYHIMKERYGKLTEDTVYDSKDYMIKIDMDKPKPKDAIGGKITIVTSCNTSKLKRSFYFTNKGNLYYDMLDKRFGFEKSQLDYPNKYSSNHVGHFRWGKELLDCIISWKSSSLEWYDSKETDFYIANPENLEKLQEDLGYERWAVLSYCEWDYVINTLGEFGWTVNNKYCYLIDTTPGKSLLTELKNNKSNKSMTKEEFESYESKGLVCLPACGSRNPNEAITFNDMYYDGYYWSCTPSTSIKNAWALNTSYKWSPRMREKGRVQGCAVRLVILADD